MPIKIANKLKLNYLNIGLNTIDDVFTGSTKLTTPIIGIGGSIRISQGKVDQLGLSVSPLTTRVYRVGKRRHAATD